MNNLQTPAILKQVRESLGLSQGSVSAATGINRSYISRFEGGVQVLSDENLQKLQDHYVDTGFDFSEIVEEEPDVNDDGNETIDRNLCTILDGFLIPEGLDSLKAEDLLDELRTHEEFIESELNKAPVEGTLFHVDKIATRNALYEVALRGLRCYSIVQELKGESEPYAGSGDRPTISPTVKTKRLRDYLWGNEEAEQ